MGGDVNDVLAFNNGSNAGGQAGSTVNIELFADGFTITANGSTGGGGTGASITLTGEASTADYSQALSQVTFSSGGNPTGASGTDTSRTITFQAVNAVNIASHETSDFLHTTVGSPPPPPGTLTVTAGGTVTFTENRSGNVFLDSGIQVSDFSGNNIRGILAAKVALSGTAISADSLAFLGGTNTQFFSATGDTLTATSESLNAGVLTMTITGTGTATEYQTVLQEVDYGANGDPTGGGAATQRTVTWSLSTDGTTFGASGTSTLDVVHTATVSAGNTQNFLEGSGPVLIEGGASFGDSDTIKSVTVALPGNEFLTAAPTADSIGFLSGTSLSGTFTFAKGQTIRTIGGDGSVFNISETSNGVFQITSVGAVTASNVDFEIAAGEVAYLNASDPTSVLGNFGVDTHRDFIWTVVDNNSSQNTFASGTRNKDGSGTIIATANDPNAVGGSIIDVFHKAPVLGVGGAVTFTGAATPSPAVLDSGLTLSTDNFDPIASATVQISSGFLSGDTLSFGAVVGATVGASTTSAGLVSETLTFGDGDTILAQFNTSTGALKLTTSSATATTGDYKAALRGIEFSDPSGVDPTNGGTDKTRSLTWTVVDQNSNANNPAGPAGNGNTATGTSTVTAAITGPILSAGALVTFTENEAPVPLDTGLALSDVNAINRATVAIGSFISGEDLLSLSSFAGATLGAASTSVVGGQTIVSETLTFTADSDTITAQFNESTGVMTLTTTGTTTQTVAEFQSALQSVEFSDPNGFDPTAGGTDTSRAITWTVIDTNAAPNNTGSSTSTVHTVHTPLKVPTGGTGVLVTYTEGQTTTTFLDSGVTLSDSDAIKSATVSVSGYQNGDILDFNGNTTVETFGDGATISASFNTASGVLTLTTTGAATASATDYAQALASVEFRETANVDPTHGGAGSETARTVTWTVTDANTNTASNTTSFSSTLDTVHKASS